MLGKRRVEVAQAVHTCAVPSCSPQPQPAHWLSKMGKETTYQDELGVKFDATQEDLNTREVPPHERAGGGETWKQTSQAAPRVPRGQVVGSVRTRGL